MKKTISILMLLFFATSTYCMESALCDENFAIELLLHLQRGTTKNTPKPQVRAHTSQKRNSVEPLLQSGQCPSCGRTFFSQGRPHPGNARRHYKTCIRTQKPSYKKHKVSKKRKKQQAQYISSDDEEIDIISMQEHQCPLCPKQFPSTVRLNAHGGAYH